MTRKNKTFVAHDCRNTRKGTCNNRWIDEDKTHTKSQLPTWKYCQECCKTLGIDFDKQTPDKNNALERELNSKED